jgi:HAD superfamily hydrolase (TIGR01493 family)
MNDFDPSPIKAILFDVYGTLVEIRDKRAPFRRLLQIGAGRGRTSEPGDAHLIMGRPLSLLDAAALLGIELADAERARLENDLRAELASIAPFPDTMPALQALKDQGFKLGLCSNLALDYAAPALAALPFELDAHVWSFDAGAIKPDPAIYAYACRALGYAPGEVLMVGDTPAADVDGPRAAGLQALLLGRTQARAQGRWGDALPSLSALCTLLAREE